MKKVMSIMLMLVMIVSLCMPAMAAESEKAEVVATAVKYGITELEVEHFKENFEAAKEKLSRMEILDGESVTVPISENLVIEVRGGSEQQRNTLARATVTQWHVWSTCHIKSNAGVEILTLTAHGYFDCDGKTSTPVDAYSDYVSFVWSVVDTNDEVKSSYTRSTFDSEFNIGIDPVSMTIQTSRDVCVLRCTPDGKGSSSWS